MKVLIIGGGETIETVYYLSRLFVQRGYGVTVINPYETEARMLARRVDGLTVIHGDGSEPAVLEDAGARQSDVVLSLMPYDPDNLVACQIAQKMFAVPRTLALVNDPENEEVFCRLGITMVFSATRVLGSLIEGQTVFDEITHLFAADEGQLHVTEIVLPHGAPAAGKRLQSLSLPNESLVAAIIREGEPLVPHGGTVLQVDDRLILVAQPSILEEVLGALTGKES